MRSAARGRDPEGRTDAAPPLPRRVPHDRGAPGAKSFVDDLILGQGFVRSRAAPSLRSIENQPSTQAFVSEAADGGQHSPPLKGKATLPPRRLSSSSSSFASSLRWGGGGGRGRERAPRGVFPCLSKKLVPAAGRVAPFGGAAAGGGCRGTGFRLPPTSPRACLSPPVWGDGAGVEGRPAPSSLSPSRARLGVDLAVSVARGGAAPVLRGGTAPSACFPARCRGRPGLRLLPVPR